MRLFDSQLNVYQCSSPAFVDINRCIFLKLSKCVFSLSAGLLQIISISIFYHLLAVFLFQTLTFSPLTIKQGLSHNKKENCPSSGDTVSESDGGYLGGIFLFWNSIRMAAATTRESFQITSSQKQSRTQCIWCRLWKEAFVRSECSDDWSQSLELSFRLFFVEKIVENIKYAEY